MTSEFWQDGISGDWKNTAQGTYTYDANNNRTSELYQHWNDSFWENGGQYIYTYDANNNMTSELDQDWNGSAFVNSSLFTLTYDADNFTLSESYKVFNNDGTAVEYGDSTYYYFHSVLGIDDLRAQEGNITVYPNPANNKITIANNKEIPEEAIVCIFEINGQQVMYEKFQNQKLIELDVSNLSNGIYLLKIETKEGIEVKKLVIQ
jgi:hypothetical protein